MDLFGDESELFGQGRHQSVGPAIRSQGATAPRAAYVPASHVQLELATGAVAFSGHASHFAGSPLPGGPPNTER